MVLKLEEHRVSAPQFGRYLGGTGIETILPSKVFRDDVVVIWMNFVSIGMVPKTAEHVTYFGLPATATLRLLPFREAVDIPSY